MVAGFFEGTKDVRWWFECGLEEKKKRGDDDATPLSSLVPPWPGGGKQEEKKDDSEGEGVLHSEAFSLGVFSVVVSLPAGSHEAATMQKCEVSD